MAFIQYCTEMLRLAQQGETQGIFFACVIFTALICATTLIIQKLIFRWPFTEGSLVNTRIDTEKAIRIFAPAPEDESGYPPEVFYTYRVNNTVYEGRQLSPWHKLPSMSTSFFYSMRVQALEWLSKDHFKVYYNPRNPAKSYLVRPGIKSQYLTGLAAFVPAAFYFLKYL